MARALGAGMLRMRSPLARERRALRSLALRAALAAASAAAVAEPLEAQFTAAVTQPLRRPVPAREAVAAGPGADTVRTTELSDLKAWVDSAAAVVGSTPAAPRAAPRDSAAAVRDTVAPGRPARAATPRRPRTPPR